MDTTFGIILLLCLVEAAAGLMCYQCATTSNTGECVTDQKAMLNTANYFIGPNAANMSSRPPPIYYLKDCDTFPNRTMCMIEVVRLGISGNILSFIRDCSDGATFSYDLALLRDLAPSNYSTCGYDNRGYQVCVTLCNGSDFCNGPQLNYVPFSSMATSVTHAQAIHIILMCLVFCMQCCKFLL